MKSKPPNHWRQHLERIQGEEKRVTNESGKNIEAPRPSGRVQLPTVEVRFSDEFAPSSTKVGATSNEHLQGAAKGLFYGDDWSEIGIAALSRACDFNLPKLIWPDLGIYQRVDDSICAVIVWAWTDAVSQVEESSEDWICLQIYYRVLQISNLYTGNAPSFLVFEEVFRLGGLVRELDLVNRNKEDALTRKGQKRAFLSQSEGRDSINHERKLKAATWHAHAESILTGLTRDLSASATADFILKHWDKKQQGSDAPDPPAKGTIQNWLSLRKKASHTRSSE